MALQLQHGRLCSHLSATLVSAVLKVSHPSDDSRRTSHVLSADQKAPIQSRWLSFPLADGPLCVYGSH